MELILIITANTLDMAYVIHNGVMENEIYEIYFWANFKESEKIPTSTCYVFFQM